MDLSVIHFHDEIVHFIMEGPVSLFPLFNFSCGQKTQHSVFCLHYHYENPQTTFSVNTMNSFHTVIDLKTYLLYFKNYEV